MPQMLQMRRGQAAERIVTAAYPQYSVEPRTRELAAELLARADIDPIMRRVVQDGDDDLRRALAARF
jgi:aminopeptidase N